jgi:predicted hydrocarbon binding protein
MSEDKSGKKFLSDKNIGDIHTGRPNLGSDVPVWIYRLMQYTLRASLENSFGSQKADEILYNAGKIAGARFCESRIGKNVDFNDFISTLQRELKENKIAIFRVEKQDPGGMEFVVTMAEDLDCSGLPVTDETVCVYDEGFLAGLMSFYSGRNFDASEVDCWATGERICRFQVKSSDEPD